jgi:hypothetical protein
MSKKSNVYTMSKIITFADSATAVKIGTLPPNCCRLNILFQTTTAFNAATTNVIDVGISSNDDKYVDGTDITAVGNHACTSLLVGAVESATVSTDVYATYKETGTAATTGVGRIVVEYIQD